MVDVNGKKTGKFYGSLKTDLVPDPKSRDKKYKRVSLANPDAEIIETLSRDQVLNYTGGEVEDKKRGRPAKTE